MADFNETYKLCLANDQNVVDFYQRKEGYLSHSSLKAFRTSPFEFLRYKTMPRLATTAMSDGQMMHLLLFEPQKFKDEYYVIDDRKKCVEISGPAWKEEGKKPRSTKAYRDWVAEYQSKFSNKSRADLEQVMNLKTAIDRAMTNPEFNAIIAEMGSPESREQVVLDRIEGYDIKAILDITTNRTTADLKFVADNSDRATYRDYWGDKYWTWVQQGLYAYFNGFKKAHKIIYLNKFGDVNIREVPIDGLERGFNEFRYWINEFDKVINKRGTLNIDSSYWKKGDNALFIPSWLDGEEE